MTTQGATLTRAVTAQAPRFMEVMEGILPRATTMTGATGATPLRATTGTATGRRRRDTGEQ